METLEIQPYDDRWRIEFQNERDRIAAALGALALRIDHNGSTAVPGLAAKPVIDIQISVTSLRPLDSYAVPLAGLGYLHVPHPDDSFCPFFHRPKQWPHTHHVHVVTAGGQEERRTLAFRDYLRDHPDAVEEYATVKKKLARVTDAQDPRSREAYATAKTEFIERTVQLAFAAGYPRLP